MYHLSDGVLEPGKQAGEILTTREKVLYNLLDTISFLKKVPLFKEVPGNYLIPLAQIARPVTLTGGATLLHQGDRGDAMYLICRGAISIRVNGVEVNRMGIGECIGEMALLDSSPRSASCVAEVETELLRISDSDFEIVVKSQTPVIFAMLRTLAERLYGQTVNPIKQGGTEENAHDDVKEVTQQFTQQEAGLKGATRERLNNRAIPSKTSSEKGLSKDERGLYKLLERIAFLQKVPLFKDVPENYLVSLEKIVHPVYLKRGETLFHQGDLGDAMYIIRFGSVSVQVNGIEVTWRSVGDCLGEMALLNGTPRFASCIAREDTELLRISANDFETMVRSQTSVMFAMLRTLAERLRQQTANAT